MPLVVSDAVLNDVSVFVRDRFYVLLRDQGLPHDVVAAVLDQQSDDPYRAAATAHALAQLVQAPVWSEQFTAYARCQAHRAEPD